MTGADAKGAANGPGAGSNGRAVPKSGNTTGWTGGAVGSALGMMPLVAAGSAMTNAVPQRVHLVRLPNSSRRTVNSVLHCGQRMSTFMTGSGKGDERVHLLSAAEFQLRNPCRAVLTVT